MIVQGSLVFLGARLFVPSSLREEFMSLTRVILAWEDPFTDVASAGSGP